MHDYAASQRENNVQNPSKREAAEKGASTHQAAKRRPSHIGRDGLRENPLQHFRRNTRNTQIRCNKGKCLSASNRSKFEHRFSNSVSSIFDAEL